jgi:hypothetical protein
MGGTLPSARMTKDRVIAHILADPAGHEGKIYTLHGPVEMNHTEMLFTKAAGAKRWLSQWHKVPPPLKGQPVQPKRLLWVYK